VGSFVRRVKTASGATAVQIVHKRGQQVVAIDHIGSAHDEDRLVLLLETAKQRCRAGPRSTRRPAARPIVSPRTPNSWPVLPGPSSWSASMLPQF
jgi:hypothetical protein